MKTKLTKDEIKSLANVITLKIKEKFNKEKEDILKSPAAIKLKEKWLESLNELKNHLDIYNKKRKALINKFGDGFEELIESRSFYEESFDDINISSKELNDMLFEHSDLFNNLKKKYEDYIILNNSHFTKDKFNVKKEAIDKIVDFITIENFDDDLDAKSIMDKILKKYKFN